MKDNKGLEEGKITLLYFVVGESYITFLLVFILFSRFLCLRKAAAEGQIVDNCHEPTHRAF